MLGTALLLGLVFVLFGLRPILERGAEDQFNVAALRVETSLNTTFSPARILLSLARDWSGGQPPDLDDPGEFNRLFMPVLRALPQVTSVVAGTSTGQAWLLLELANGGWRNRMTDLPGRGQRHRFFEHAPDGSVTSYWKALDYDARLRPWYRVATAGSESERVQWTEPYLFFTTGDPGISASIRWLLKDGRDFVLGFDLKLRDLSRTTLRASVGKRGLALVVTDDWRVLALPAMPDGVQENEWLKRVLKPVAELGLRNVDALRSAWQAADKTTEVFQFRIGATQYLANVRPYFLGGQRFWVVTLAPSLDFMPAWRPVALALAGGLVVILFLAFLIARFQARSIARPLEALALASERTGRLDFSDPPAMSGIAEILQLEEAQAAMRGMLRRNQEILASQAKDLTDQVEALQVAEARILESEIYNKVLFADSRIPLVVLDPDSGRFVDCNQAAVAIYHLQRREAVLGLTPLDVSAPAQHGGLPSAEAASEHIRQALEQGSRVFEWRHRRPDGTEWDAEVHLMAFDYQGRTLIQFSLQDITERKTAKDALQRLAFYDTLTELPNRALLLDRLGQALATVHRHEQSLALLFLDLDRFKEINDTQGHSVGDRVLQEVARRFQSVLRQDESMARMGGDEFVVLAMGADQVVSALIAERLIAALAVPLEIMGHRFSLSASIGIVLYPQDGRTPDDLLQHADVAMYRAKSSGGGYRFYRPEMSAGLAERMMLARDLRAALQRRGGELSLHFQPQIKLENGELVGAEALMRWHRPEHGDISPALFIPIAEERGMMAELGTWVLEEACRQLNTWQAEGRSLPGRLAVNIATQQIESLDFPDLALAIVRRAGLSPSQFELELTESGLMRDVELAINIAGRLKAAGFALAIDDFGTGYSSLAYLKRLPMSKVKIDMSFVNDMLIDHNDYAIVNTIIGMGRTLDLMTLAEGVETRAQAETLLAMGCYQAQGYYFGRPEPGAAFARRWLNEPGEQSVP